MSPDKYRNVAAVALGANMDEPAARLREALARLKAAAGLEFMAESRVYLTEPQGGPADQDWYHNSAALFKTVLRPPEFLRTLMETEASMGRVRGLERWGPRIIDLDYLFHGSLMVNDPPDLELPHPRLHERRFVLAPLAEVAPDWVHPALEKTVKELLAALPEEGQEIHILEA